MSDQKSPQPIDVVDGIADRSVRPARWTVMLLGVGFLVWVAALAWLRLATL